MEDQRPTPSLVVAAYAQSLVEGRKVVVFGDCTSGLAEHLLERGARLVHVYDSDLTRVAEAAARGSAREIAYAPLGQSGNAVRDGSFDFGIVENLAASPNPAELLKRLRRALAARGVAVVVAPNREVDPVLLPDDEERAAAPSYYELFELISKEFDEVRMVGQTPFVGYALADFTPGRGDEFSIDTAFVEGGAEEPEWYLAVASHFPVGVEPFLVVQLPAAQTLGALAGVDGDALVAARARVAELEGALAQKPREQKERSESSRDRELLVQANQEIEKRDAWVLELEGRAAAADARADEAESRAEEAEAKLEAERLESERVLAAKLEAERLGSKRALAAKLEAERLESERVLAAKLEAERLESERALAAKLEAERLESKRALAAKLEALKSDLERAKQRATAAEARVRELEQQLAARSEERSEKRSEEPVPVVTPAPHPNEERERAAERRRLDALQAELDREREQSEVRQRDLEDQAEMITSLTRELEETEAQLRERAQALVQRERDLQKTEHLAGDLLTELEQLRERAEAAPREPVLSPSEPVALSQATSPVDAVAPMAPPPQAVPSRSGLDELQANLEELARVDARHVADLTAAQWTIQELENKLFDQEAETRDQLERLRAELQQKVALLQQLQHSQSG